MCIYMISIPVMNVFEPLTRCVRQAVLVATSIILLVLPSFYLLTDLQVDLMETKAWLESKCEHWHGDQGLVGK